ncbi:MAG: transposase [Deltaproteobacteria bacterium]|nr:transposase [Deltaproteobacteria bacterium]
MLRWPWPNGATHLDLDPMAFLRRLALLIPRPRQNMIRYQGPYPRLGAVDWQCAQCQAPRPAPHALASCHLQ